MAVAVTWKRSVRELHFATSLEWQEGEEQADGSITYTSLQNTADAEAEWSSTDTQPMSDCRQGSTIKWWPKEGLLKFTRML